MSVECTTSARELVASIVEDGMTIAVGGFGLCGVPHDLIEGVRDSGAKDLTIVSNNMGCRRPGGSEYCWKISRSAKQFHHMWGRISYSLNSAWSGN